MKFITEFIFNMEFLLLRVSKKILALVIVLRNFSSGRQMWNFKARFLEKTAVKWKNFEVKSITEFIFGHFVHIREKSPGEIGFCPKINVYVVTRPVITRRSRGSHLFLSDHYMKIRTLYRLPYFVQFGI